MSQKIISHCIFSNYKKNMYELILKVNLLLWFFFIPFYFLFKGDAHFVLRGLVTSFGSLIVWIKLMKQKHGND